MDVLGSFETASCFMGDCVHTEGFFQDSFKDLFQGFCADRYGVASVSRID